MDYVQGLGPAILDRRVFAMHDVIAQQGSPVGAIWLLLRGTAVLKTGPHQSTAFIKSAGSLYGDVETILGLPYQGNLVVTAEEGVEAVRIAPDRFKAAIDRGPDFLRVLSHLNALRVIKSAHRVEQQAAVIDESQQHIAALEQQIINQFYPDNFDPADPPEKQWQLPAE
ncbi:MAG: cyclic nucleotide-binding domain-containing protein [Pseudomonadota bacterium]